MEKDRPIGVIDSGVGGLTGPQMAAEENAPRAVYLYRGYGPYALRGPAAGKKSSGL